MARKLLVALALVLTCFAGGGMVNVASGRPACADDSQHSKGRTQCATTSGPVSTTTTASTTPFPSTTTTTTSPSTSTAPSTTTTATTATTTTTATTATTPGTPAPSRGPAVGAHFHCTWTSYTDADRTAILDKLAATGLTWVRIDMGWGSFQEQGRGLLSEWYVSLADKCVDMARARGLNVLVVLGWTPPWANGGNDANVPPLDVTDYAWIARWASEHFRGRVAAWEVWNEPNQQVFWNGTQAQYVDLLKAAYPAFKAGDPSCVVVLGSPNSNNDAWIGGIYAAGAKSSFDVVSTHPYQGLANAAPDYYPAPDRWWLMHYPAVKAVMDQYGDSSKPVWFTEFGWSSHANTGSEPSWALGVTEQQQGDFTVDALKIMAGWPNVKVAFLYNERNTGSGNVHEDNFGILRADLSEKPLYGALRSYLTAR